MTSDEDIAALLGARPSAEPGFRFGVFARIAQRAQRRAAFERAVLRVAVFTAIGLAFPVSSALGAEAAPLLSAAAGIGLSLFCALAVIEGPRAVLARSRAALTAF